jgi:hypothetical protein
VTGNSSAPTITADTESWNGTSWTEVNNVNTARNMAAGGGADNTSALIFGSETPSPAKAYTESWNGTSWTEVNDLNTGRAKLGGSGASNTSALAFGGEAITTASEEWNAPTETIITFDATDV